MRKGTFLLGLLLSLFFQVFLPARLMPQEEAKPAGREVAFNRDWAENAFAGVPTPMVPTNRLVLVYEETPGTTKKNLSSGGSPLRLGGKTYKRGLGVSSRSVLGVRLSQPAVRFAADIGVDRFFDSAGTFVRFLVTIGDRKVFVSEAMKSASGARSIDVPLNGARAFDLIVEVEPGGRSAGRADWADARVTLQDGSQLWLDELADQWEVEIVFPFSFTLDGKPSREFLHQWKRDVEVKQVDAGRLQRILTLQDPKTGLEVRAVATIYLDTPGVDWTVYLTNRGTQDSPVIENLRALDVMIAPGVGTVPTLHRLRGSEAKEDDWQPYDDSLKLGRRIEFAPIDGKSSYGACPFFNLQFGGGGVITAIGWSGRWSAATEWQKDGRLRLEAGLQNLHLRLHPGESIRGPRVMQLYWFGESQFRAHNLFRATMLRHITPRIKGDVVVPPIAHLSTSFYELNESTESDVLSYLESIKGLGFEMLWLDAYWTKGGFPEGMGNYGFPIQRAEPSDRFPRGLKPIGDAAHREGMGFLLWFEPERVHAGTFIAQEHSEWVISLGKDKGGLFNLGLPEAREYMTKYLIAALKAYGVDCMRIDYNISPGPFWQHLDVQDPDRVGLAEIRYVEGFYQMWDDILREFPGLFIDNCAGGGMRIDLETASRSLALWRTDGTIFPLIKLDFDRSALQNQVITAGLSRYLPFSTSGQMGTTPYWFRSGFNAGISFSEDTRHTGYPREQLRQAIAEGKRIRKYFFGNFYPLNEVTTSAEDWCVLQYHRPAEQDGMVLAFRRHRSPYASYALILNEIDPAAQYEVTFYPTYKAAKTAVLAGIDLRQLKAEIADCSGSLLIEYRRLDH